MKRFFLVCVMVSLFGMTKAQIVDSIYLSTHDFYFRFEHSYPLDTAQYGYPMYLFNEPHNLFLNSNFNPNEENPFRWNRVSHLPYVFLQKYDNGPSDGVLYGIATTVLRPDTGYFTNPGALRFVVAGHNTTNVIDVRASMSIDSYRVDKMFDYFVQDNEQYGPSHIYSYMHEYYFEHPIPLRDLPNPFLIGTLMDSSVTMYNYFHYSHIPILTFGQINNGRIRWLFRDTPIHDWDSIPMQHTWGVFFPIVRPDSLLCGRVENFRLEERGEDYARLAWHPSRPFRDLYSGTFQVALGGLGPQPDTSNILTFSDTLATLTSLDSGVWYSTWVRGECCHCGCPMHGDTLIWGPWRGPVQFYLGSRQPGAEGITSPVANLPSLTLTPNPASGHILVTLQGLNARGSLSIVDSKGSEVLHLDDTSLPLSLDTSPLAPGIYILRLHTPSASYSQKLIVAER